MSKQYCRYCAFCIDGDALYCTEHEKVLTSAGIRRANNCPDFALSDLGDVETGKPYTPRLKNHDDGMEQLSLLKGTSE